MRLQDFGYRNSPYARPNQDWVCGWAASGRECQRGPDGRGRCHQPSECLPRKEGGRYRCTRSDLAGGPCGEGPGADGGCGRRLPRCRPRRSWPARRRLAGWWALSVAIGLVMMIVMSESVPVLFEPGHRSAAHAEIDDCTACHLTAEMGPGHWLHAALGALEGRADSQRCLDCHRVGSAPHQAHSTPAAELEPLTIKLAAQAPPMPLRQRLVRAVDDGVGAPACGVCHQEHRGAKSDLEAVDNGRCQVCHVAPFASLADGHPEFTRYPAPRRTRIVFDHVGHFNQHFETDAELAPPKTCDGCHAPDDAGRLMLVKPYETVCAACHDRDIAGAGQAGSRGLAVITVPGLDTAALRDAGHEIGDWPRHADAGLSPVLRRLLAADPANHDFLAALDGVALWDLGSADPARLAAATRLGLAVKQLLAELQREGGAALIRRLEAWWGRPLEAIERVHLVAMLPVAAVARANERWFPRLEEELAAWRAGEPIPAPAPPAPVAPAEPEPLAEEELDDLFGGGLFDGGELVEEKPAQVARAEPETAPAEERMRFGGWYVDDLSLRYRPAGHRDDFLKAWIEAEPDSDLFDHLSAPDTPGRCGYCHSVDADESGAVRINWQPRMPKPRQHPFTVFSHTAHFSMLGEPGCKTCHRLDESADYEAGFADRDPDTFASNFQNIDRAVCAQCHTADLAGDDCTLCHRYHIGEFEPTVPPTRLSDF